MANLSVPPPSRIAVGSVVINGQRFEVLLNPEWGRYFESLNTQVVTTGNAVGQPGAPGQTGAAGAAVSFANSDAEGSVEFIPLMGPQGAAGADGAPGTAGTNGTNGAAGANGAALFLLQHESEGSDWMPRGTLPNEGFITPTLLNSWAVFNVATNTPGYYKDAHGIVHLRGMVKSGTVGAAIFTLPVGYRPVKQELFACVSNDLFGRVDVNSSGDVTLMDGSNVFASLDGITFRAVGTY